MELPGILSLVASGFGGVVCEVWAGRHSYTPNHIYNQPYFDLLASELRLAVPEDLETTNSLPRMHLLTVLLHRVPP